MDKKKRNAIIGVVAVIVVIAFVANFAIKGAFSSKYDEFAQCLTDNGAIMYGTDWCPHCKDQKEMFGSSFENVNYVNCDRATAVCQQKGVEGFPTWIFNDEKSITGTQELSTLAAETGCQLPEE